MAKRFIKLVCLKQIVYRDKDSGFLVIENVRILQYIVTTRMVIVDI